MKYFYLYILILSIFIILMSYWNVSKSNNIISKDSLDKNENQNHNKKSLHM